MENKKQTSDLSISWEDLMELYAAAQTEAELEQSGKRYKNDLLFAPVDTQTYRDFIEFSDYLGE